MNSYDIDNRGINAFIQKFQVKGEATIRVLATLKQYYNAIKTPAGRELLKDIDRLMREKGEQIRKNEATEYDKGQFDAYVTLGEKTAERIMKFYKTTDLVKNEIELIPDENETQ